MSIFQNIKNKISWEKWHCIPFFADVFPARLKETDGISCLLPRSICCAIAHHVASSKCYYTFMRKWTKQITSQYDQESSFDRVDLKAILIKQWFAVILKP